jgi:hypothetical protein
MEYPRSFRIRVLFTQIPQDTPFISRQPSLHLGSQELAQRHFKGALAVSFISVALLQIVEAALSRPAPTCRTSPLTFLSFLFQILQVFSSRDEIHMRFRD